jgi:hypothetical protein
LPTSAPELSRGRSQIQRPTGILSSILVPSTRRHYPARAMVNAFNEASTVERMDDHTFPCPPSPMAGSRVVVPLAACPGHASAFHGAMRARARAQCACAHGDLCGAVLPGEAEIHVAQLRRDGRMTYPDAQFRQQTQVIARASAVLASSRDDVVAPALPAPAPPRPPPWRSVAGVAVQPPFGPAFALLRVSPDRAGAVCRWHGARSPQDGLLAVSARSPRRSRAHRPPRR